jgi:hypothetical protein
MTTVRLDFFQEDYLMTIEEGIDFIEGHLVPPIYPRRIATYRTGGRQTQVNNRDDDEIKNGTNDVYKNAGNGDDFQEG